MECVYCMEVIKIEIREDKTINYGSHLCKGLQESLEKRRVEPRGNYPRTDPKRGGGGRT